MRKTHIAICDPYLNTKGGGEKCAVATAEVLSKMPGVEVSLLVYDKTSTVNKDELAGYFQADLSRVTIRQVKKDEKLLDRYAKYQTKFPPIVRDFLKSYIEYKAFREHNIDIFINNFYKSDIFCPAPVGIYFCMFPQKLAPPTDFRSLKGKVVSRLLNIAKKKYSIESEPSNMIDTYQKIISISTFTRDWVSKLWDRDSEIVYPICENMLRKGVGKEKIILNVGRFFGPGGDSHHKKQEVLLEAFIEMSDLHKKGWELHFAGAIARTTEAMEFALSLVMRAKGYPVFFHFSAPFDDLKTLYNKATIYWHATGYGVDEHKHPEQHEHFGITTVEAMSAGAIPIVIKAAGQLDTVVTGKTGYLWTSQDELKNQTRIVSAMGDDERDVLKENAIKFAKNFSKKSYQDSIVSIVGNYINL
ncbi:glycosyltransferase [Candidatus Saccharibacteria bacterium]|nr:glycosyltransferase [Candidatus Saccharibacteria bacterium]MCA9313410.1 glycosyltransferase [Candidatus Saccharibacteria bacterium]